MLQRLFLIFVVVPLAIVLVVFAVANRHPVTVSLDPFGSDAPSLTATVPLFLLILLLLALGVIFGGLSTWMGQAKWRKMARHLDRETRALRAERGALRAERDALRSEIAARNVVQRDVPALPNAEQPVP